MSLRWALGMPALLLVGPILLLLIHFVPRLDRTMLAIPSAHLAISGGAATLGIVLALLVLRVGQRSNDSRTFLIGLALLSTALIFLVHALSTPNVIFQGLGRITGLSAQLSLVLGSLFFALSALELSPSINRRVMHRARTVLALVLLAWCVGAWSMLTMRPPVQPVLAGTANGAESAEAAARGSGAPGHDHAAMVASVSSPAADPLADPSALLLVVSLSCYAFAGWRYYALYRCSPSPVGIALVCGIVLFGQALITQELTTAYTLSFWLYHFQEFSGFAVISSAVLSAYRRGLSNEGLLESLFLPGTRARIQANYSQALDALIEALGCGVQPTAALRFTLRERFGLAESQIQALERAAAAVAKERQQREELERLNRQLRQLERDKEQLTQMVVHDLKTPLTALVGFLEVLRLDRLSADQELLVESALRSGRSLSGLIGDLLDIAKMEEGKLELDRSVFLVHDLLRECAAGVGAWLAQEDKVLEIEPSEPVALAADMRLMRRLMLNLISNAIKHTPPGTRIVLRASLVAGPKGEGWCAIEVADDGPGIAPQHLELIFERFGRVGAAQTERQQSTGLGLAFCRLVAEAHDGSISVSSSVGQGTTFRVLLPNAQCITPGVSAAPLLAGG